MSILHDIHAQGQSIWYDFISRDYLRSGRMAAGVTSGIRGMTSNPTIFEGAIAGGFDYDEQIRELHEKGFTVPEIATQLFIEDIRDACDLMRPVYDQSGGEDGYISLEVAPTLADDTEGTVREGEHLWSAVDRPNLMIKIPATPEGYPAIRRVIAAGINVNITLIFSLSQYREVADAYISGLEDRVAAGGSIDTVHSVASVFISRIDSMIDGDLDKVGTPEALELRGKAGLANARNIYRAYREIFSGPRFTQLQPHGANRQRPLWASTSTKNPDYPDLLYVDNLIFPETVNTVPPATLTAILDHGRSEAPVSISEDEDNRILERIEEAGVSIVEVMDRLLVEGVEKFSASFASLFEKIAAKLDRLKAEG